MRAMHAAEAEAQDWLYQVARERKVAVRFTPDGMLREPANLRAAARNWEPPEHAAGEEGPHCAWFSPRCSMVAPRHRPLLQLSVEHDSEWDAGQLQAALEEAAPAAEASRKGAGGRPVSDDWLAVMVEVGSWLERDAAPETIRADVERYICERFQARRLSQPAEGHARERAKLALGAWRNWRSEAAN
jgi:hypothetical protein